MAAANALSCAGTWSRVDSTGELVIRDSGESGNGYMVRYQTLVTIESDAKRSPPDDPGWFWGIWSLNGSKRFYRFRRGALSANAAQTLVLEMESDCASATVANPDTPSFKTVSEIWTRVA